MQPAPTITSVNNTTFTNGTANTFMITTDSAYPSGVAITASGTLPPGVAFTDNGDGTATLSGTPLVGNFNNSLLSITASNGVVPDAHQTFTLSFKDPAPTPGGGGPGDQGSDTGAGASGSGSGSGDQTPPPTVHHTGRVLGATTRMANCALIPEVKTSFKTIFGRTPTKTEWQFWTYRVQHADKTTLSQLMGAMYWSKAHNVTFNKHLHQVALPHTAAYCYPLPAYSAV